MTNSISGSNILKITDFLSENMEATKQWNNNFETLKERHHDPRILYPVRLSFRKEGKIKILICFMIEPMMICIDSLKICTLICPYETVEMNCI
jgi:hypothetical protein